MPGMKVVYRGDYSDYRIGERVLAVLLGGRFARKLAAGRLPEAKR